MKIYGNGFTMIDSNEYDLIQLINKIDMNRIDDEAAKKEQRNSTISMVAAGLGLIAAKIILAAVFTKAITQQK